MEQKEKTLAFCKMARVPFVVQKNGTRHLYCIGEVMSPTDFNIKKGKIYSSAIETSQEKTSFGCDYIDITFNHDHDRYRFQDSENVEDERDLYFSHKSWDQDVMKSNRKMASAQTKIFRQNIVRSFGLELQPPCPICSSDLIFEDCKHIAPPYCSDCRAYFIKRKNLDGLDTWLDQISEIHQDESSKVKIIVMEEHDLNEDYLQSPTYSTVMSESFESAHTRLSTTADFQNKDIEVFSFDTVDYEDALTKRNAGIYFADDEEVYYNDHLNIRTQPNFDGVSCAEERISHTDPSPQRDWGYDESYQERSDEMSLPTLPYTLDSKYSLSEAESLKRHTERKKSDDDIETSANFDKVSRVLPQMKSKYIADDKSESHFDKKMDFSTIYFLMQRLDSISKQFQ